ncbi:MAG TPA: N-methyl-L-tryptophan oxidase [Candidatus Dormibacteraeota bacterium]|nr:N-methyl-L-tryptophan oxidase [Candidatus Dormibacteraeota bacterium]
MSKGFDVAVIGAGVFGSWIALRLAQAGKKVALLDAYGPANARSSSGGESRIIRMGYGADELYTRWSMRSLNLWKEFAAKTGDALFHRTGVLWLARERETYTAQTLATLGRCGVRTERLTKQELRERYPQFSFEDVDWGLLEPDSGALLARRAVQAVVAEALKSGAVFFQAGIAAPNGRGRLPYLTTSSGAIHAEALVFACGAWLGKLFPDFLGARIFPSRQEVFFFGVPAGDTRFASPAMPTWLFRDDQVYGLPDLESRGFKMALDVHGERVDPDSQSRMVSAESAATIKNYLARRFPPLADAPIVETRVCQYENTSNGDFLVDRHPDLDNVWLVGGGSGHGFKHGPVLGEYVAARVTGAGAVEPRFTLGSKTTIQKRAVF